MTSLAEKLAALAPDRRRKVETRAGELIDEELSLKELRQRRGHTQGDVARQAGLTQDGISRIESRSDMKISTLERLIAAQGGRLRLFADFDGEVVELRKTGPTAANDKGGRSG